MRRLLSSPGDERPVSGSVILGQRAPEDQPCWTWEKDLEAERKRA
jgi:hypothetical protein